MKKAIGKIKKTCKFCGEEYVVYAGNISAQHPRDFCSKRCATFYRYKEHSSTPFPPKKTIMNFWREEYVCVLRIVKKFVRNFPRVPFSEAMSEALYIVASALRFTHERLKIFARIKGGLIDFFFKFYQFSIPYSPLTEIENMIIKQEETIKQSADLSAFKAVILASNLKCMHVLKDYLESYSRDEICVRNNLKRHSDVDTNIKNAVNHLKLIAENGKVKKDSKLERHFEEIKSDLEANTPLKKMLRKYDCSKTCFFDFLKRQGITPPSKKKKEMLLSKLDDIRQDLQNGMIRRDVQKKYNCSKSTLERLIRIYNLRNYAIAN